MLRKKGNAYLHQLQEAIKNKNEKQLDLLLKDVPQDAPVEALSDLLLSYPNSLNPFVKYLHHLRSSKVPFLPPLCRSIVKHCKKSILANQLTSEIALLEQTEACISFARSMCCFIDVLGEYVQFENPSPKEGWDLLWEIVWSLRVLPSGAKLMDRYEFSLQHFTKNLHLLNEILKIVQINLGVSRHYVKGIGWIERWLLLEQSSRKELMQMAIDARLYYVIRFVLVIDEYLKIELEEDSNFKGMNVATFAAKLMDLGLRNARRLRALIQIEQSSFSKEQLEISKFMLRWVEGEVIQYSINDLRDNELCLQIIQEMKTNKAVFYQGKLTSQPNWAAETSIALLEELYPPSVSPSERKQTDLSPYLYLSIKETRYYTIQELRSLRELQQPLPYQTRISIRNQKVMQLVHNYKKELTERGPVTDNFLTVLNPSYQSPGGYNWSSLDQPQSLEMTISQVSGLSLALSSNKLHACYRNKVAFADGTHPNEIIYSKYVPVFRNEKEWVDVFTINVLTAFAVSFGGYEKATDRPLEVEDQIKLCALMKYKMRNILLVAANEKVKVLVLGNFGSTLGSPAAFLAETWFELLATEFKGVFEHVLFAVPDFEDVEMYENYKKRNKFQ